MKQHQLPFVFADSPTGSGCDESTGEPAGKAYLLQTAKARKVPSFTTPADDTSRLLNDVVSSRNLAAALLHVASKKGAPGVDGRSIGEVVAVAHRLLPCLRRDLLSGRYHPGDIRRKWIPKPGGGERGLGIPNVVDRWVQQAIHQVLSPLFEPSFHGSSHGFRPGRGARTSLAEAQENLGEERTWVASLDLSKFFDRVNHQRLLSRLALRIDDGRLLCLIHRLLKAKVVLPDGTRVLSVEGTPQGGPLSPLLSNVVLDELDQELERRGLHFVRYADDVNIFVGSERAGHRVMTSISRFIVRRMRLAINEKKSIVARPEDVHILGFSLHPQADGQVEVHLSARSCQRLATRIRELTPRNWGASLARCIFRVNRYLGGWLGYFRLCTEGGAQLFKRYDARIRRRIRAIVVRQKKRPRHLYRHLRARGVTHGAAAKAAWSRRGPWYTSCRWGLHRAYPNAWFHERMTSLWHDWSRHQAPRGVSGQLNLFGPEIPT